MAKIGLSKLVLAKYTDAGSGVVSYADAISNQKLASYSYDIEFGDDNNLYLDNQIAETEQGVFLSGSLTLETGDLDAQTTKYMLSVVEKEITVGSDTLKEVVYDDTTKSIDLGVGFIEKHRANGVDFYRAILLMKVNFSIPAGSATTQGETIDWQTTEITGTIQRSAENNSDVTNPWQKTVDCTSEEQALAYLHSVLKVAVED